MLVDVKGCGDLLSSQKIYARRFAIVQLAAVRCPDGAFLKSYRPQRRTPFPHLSLRYRKAMVVQSRTRIADSGCMELRSLRMANRHVKEQSHKVCW
jgi:hypothetical protein